ncbi:MAG: tRNA epoxyqueuosine(34) reductase QueG [Bacteroidota bacterium]
MPGFDQQAQARLAHAIKAEARRLGFDACGISKAERLDDEARRLEAWLNAGMHGTMGWMENHFEKRVDPRELVPGAKSVISLLHNYYQPVEHAQGNDIGKISRYAWGDDYHFVMKERLFELYNWLDEEVGGIDGRAFVDSAPVLDKAWARRSGVGWQGKHSNIINRTLGSYFFIGELIIDVPLPPDGPLPDYCGSCTRCLDACPTDAITQPYVVDANKCIAYLTIEHRADDIAPELQPLIGNWVFGCDICQDVCPWNKFKRPTTEPRYLPRPGMADTTLREWAEIDIEEFRRQFRKNPVKRTKWAGFERNVRMALENAANPVLPEA